MKRLVILPALALSACGAGVSSEVRIEKVYVSVPAACPDKETYAKLKSDRPAPLRDRPMPGTPEERVAQTGAQLGRYEAEGGWGDRVVKALDRCQTPGVAPAP
jgi:hypothetical protein